MELVLYSADGRTFPSSQKVYEFHEDYMSEHTQSAQSSAWLCKCFISINCYYLGGRGLPSCSQIRLMAKALTWCFCAPSPWQHHAHQN